MVVALVSMILALTGADSARAETGLLVDIDPRGMEGSNPFAPSVVGDRAWFLVSEPGPDGIGKENWIWVTDGTEAGTLRIEASQYLYRIDLLGSAVRGDRLYFTAQDPQLGEEILRFDASAPLDAPPVVIDLEPGAASSWPRDLTAVDGKVFYTRWIDDEFELWRLSGGETGIYLGSLLPPPSGRSRSTARSSIPPSIPPSTPPAMSTQGPTKGPYFEPDPQQLHPWGRNLAAFVLDEDGDGYVSREEEEWLWISDGTPGGTRPVAEVTHIGDYSSEALAVGDRLFFPAWDAEHGQELWVSDGTAEGTGMLVDLRPGPEGSSVGVLAATATHVYFGASTAPGESSLWRSDGTAAGTREVSSSLLGGPWEAGGTIYFATYSSAGDPITGYELWRVVGEPPRVERVVDLAPGFEGTFPRVLGAEGGLLYFSTATPDLGHELWVTDGTADGTRLVADVAPGGLSSEPRSLFRLGGRLVFSADDGVHGRELWASDLECLPSAEILCLAGDRFEVRSRWSVDEGAGGSTAGPGRAVGLSSETGAFWFFDAGNLEMVVKVLDGCLVNGHFWVFLASLSNVEFELEVLDTVTGGSRLYRNPEGSFASFGDVEALPIKNRC